MNQDDGPSLAFHDEVQIRAIYLNETRFRAGMIVRDATGDVALFESSGNCHN